nr:MAG TPA: hypothetical protein [Caudoviricetes sp.]
MRCVRRTGTKTEKRCPLRGRIPPVASIFFAPPLSGFFAVVRGANGSGAVRSYPKS